MSFYDIIVLGSVAEDTKNQLEETLKKSLDEFGLNFGDDVRLIDSTTVSLLNRKVPAVVAYFGSPDQDDLEILQSLISQKLPVIPVAERTNRFNDDVPDLLKGLNAHFLEQDDNELNFLAASLLECVGLLREQRRIFVSYRRTESRSVAIQLHDLLTAKGFDVFLDTHDIRPGEPFQDVLWHRLVDSDVMIMLDTPSYFESKWTRQELGRARAKEIHVLRVVWPNHESPKALELSEAVYLEEDDLLSPDGPVRDSTAERIAAASESLRSRSIASRYLSIAGKLCEEAERIGASVEGVGAHRAISLRLLDDTHLWAFLAVGLPSAELLNDIAEKSENVGKPGTPVLIYDHVGIRDKWQRHLEWLTQNIQSVRILKIREADWLLAGWEE